MSLLLFGPFLWRTSARSLALSTGLGALAFLWRSPSFSPSSLPSSLPSSPPPSPAQWFLLRRSVALLLPVASWPTLRHLCCLRACLSPGPRFSSRRWPGPWSAPLLLSRRLSPVLPAVFLRLLATFAALVPMRSALAASVGIDLLLSLCRRQASSCSVSVRLDLFLCLCGFRDRTCSVCGSRPALVPLRWQGSHLGVRGFLLHNACGEGARLGCLLLERFSVDYEKKSIVWTCPKRRPSWSRVLWYADETLMTDMRPCATS